MSRLDLKRFAVAGALLAVIANTAFAINGWTMTTPPRNSLVGTVGVLTCGGAKGTGSPTVFELRVKDGGNTLLSVDAMSGATVVGTGWTGGATPIGPGGGSFPAATVLHCLLYDSTVPTAEVILCDTWCHT